MARSAEDLAAASGHRLSAVLLEVFPKRIIGGDKEPSLTPLSGHRLSKAMAERVGVIRPVDEVSRALRASHNRRARARSNHRLVLFVRDGQHGQGNRRIR